MQTNLGNHTGSRVEEQKEDFFPFFSYLPWDDGQTYRGQIFLFQRDKAKRIQIVILVGSEAALLFRGSASKR